MKNDAFSAFHPAVNLAFFVAALGMTMFLMQPVCLLLSLLSACAYLLYLKGLRGAARQVGYLLPLLVFMAVLNPLFNHEGMTILFYLPNDNPVTLEAAVYGLASAVMMAASITWFNCCNVVFTSDKILYLFGRVIPALSLLLSMTLRFVPRFKNYLQEVWRVQRGLREPKTALQRLRQALAAFSATVSWAMEQSIVCSDSMKSRGYGMAGRTAYSIFRFTRRDALALLSLLVLCAGALVPFLAGQMAWSYYPTLSGTPFGTVQIFSCLCYAGVCLLPLTIDLMEDQKWHSLRSKL